MSRSILLFCAIGNLLLIPLFSSAQNQNLDSYFEKRTAWGDPNIQGVWDKRTVTPLERPARFENRAFLSPEEIIEYEKASAEREDGRPLDFARTSISVHDPEDLDYGSTYVTTGQTSLVTEPSNGRIPYYTEAANERTEKARKMKEGRGPADSWIDRNLTERCLTWEYPKECCRNHTTTI